MARWVLGILLVNYLVPVEAQIRESTFVHRGSGCRQGTVSYAVSPDKMTLSVLYDQFSVRSDAKVDPITQLLGVTETDCEVEFLVILPNKRRLKSLKVDYRGLYSVADGHRLDLLTRISHTEYGSGSVQSGMAPDVVQYISGPNETDFLISHSAPSLKTRCGESIVVRLRSIMKIEKLDPAASGVTFAQFDSADIQTPENISMRVGFEPCK